jgi:serpin B
MKNMNHTLKFLLLTPLLLTLSIVFLKADDALDLQSVVDGNTTFALNLYDKLDTKEGNLFFSPYSISTVLALVDGGADGTTEKQMTGALHLGLSPEKLSHAFAALDAKLKMVQAKNKITLLTANSLWPQQDFHFLPSYIALARESYDAAITPVDYVGDSEGARKQINDWVEARTRGKITNLIQPGALDESSRLVVVNAIYFKGAWANRFNTQFTQPLPFHVSSEKTVTTPMMQLSQSSDKFGYAEFPGLKVLELPYAGDDVSMLVLLPDQVDGIKDLEGKLTAQNLALWTKNLYFEEVNVTLPTFKATSQFSLGEELAALGMTDAFDKSKADFSRMDGTNDLYVGAVIHKAFVDVNEEGTEAAASTAVVMEDGATAMEPRTGEFHADHPFLFLIRDNGTGGILFLGRVSDPTTSQ